MMINKNRKGSLYNINGSKWIHSKRFKKSAKIEKILPV